TLTAITFGVTGGAITSAILADTTQQASANAFVQITDGTGAGAVLTPVFSGDEQLALTGVTVVDGGSGYAAGVEIHTSVYGVIDWLPIVFTATVDGGGTITSAAPTGPYVMPPDLDPALI